MQRTIHAISEFGTLRVTCPGAEYQQAKLLVSLGPVLSHSYLFIIADPPREPLLGHIFT